MNTIEEVLEKRKFVDTLMDFINITKGIDENDLFNEHSIIGYENRCVND